LQNQHEARVSGNASLPTGTSAASHLIEGFLKAADYTPVFSGYQMAKVLDLILSAANATGVAGFGEAPDLQ
jgi:hypothetical protein